MKRRKVYLAARYNRIDELKVYRGMLTAAGVQVTSLWLNGERRIEDADLGKSDDPDASSRAQRIALADLEDVHRSDIVMSFTEPERKPTRGGRHVEFGYAFALGKRLILVGPGEHVFHRLPGVERYDTFDDALQAVIS